MKKSQSKWYDSARNGHTFYSEKTLQRVRDAGFMVYHHYGPWTGLSGLVPKYPQAKHIYEFEPAHDSGEQVIIGSKDFIEGLTKQMNDWNAQLLADPDKAKRVVLESGIDKLGAMEMINKPSTRYIQMTRGDAALNRGTLGHDFTRGYFIVDEDGTVVYADEERYHRVLEWYKQYKKDNDARDPDHLHD